MIDFIQVEPENHGPTAAGIFRRDQYIHRNYRGDPPAPLRGQGVVVGVVVGVGMGVGMGMGVVVVVAVGVVMVTFECRQTRGTFGEHDTVNFFKLVMQASIYSN